MNTPFGFILIILSLTLSVNLFPSSFASKPARAQSPQTETPTALVSDTVIWRASLTKVVPQANLDAGAILHVYVQGREGEFVEVRQINTVINNTTGTKQELGPYAAEFAPLSPGRWLISLPAFGASTAIQTDDDSLFEVTFEQVLASQATAEARPQATPTPLENVTWQGIQTGQKEGPSLAGALLRVKVADKPGLPVDLRTLTDYVGQGVTGSKSEYPKDEVEFAGLSPGRYVIVPHGLNTEYIVDLDVNTTTYIEFKAAPTPTPTATPLPPRPTATPTVTQTPSPTATPLSRWQVSVDERRAVEKSGAQLTVNVGGDPNEQLLVSGGDPFQEISCLTTRRIETGVYACDVAGLLPGVYTVSLNDHNINTPIRLKNKEIVTLAFSRQPIRDENSNWQVSVNQNTNDVRPVSVTRSKLTIQLTPKSGQIISVINSRGQRRLCETDDDGQCQFSRLGAGVYRIETASVPIQYSLFLDGIGEAIVAFELSGTIEQVSITDIAPTTEPVSGGGAIPRTSPTATETSTSPPPPPTVTPTATATTPPTASPTATPLAPAPTLTPTMTKTATSRPAPPTPTRTATRPRPATATATVTITPTATQSFAWLGAVIDDYQHPGQTLVVQAALGNHPVILRSGPWQAEGFTDTKPEYGSGATEFAGLPAGRYTVELVGLSETTVDIATDRFVRVLFSYGPAPTPTPTAAPGQWTAAIVENTSGTEPGGGAWSILTVQVGTINNLPVRVFTDSFETECVTGTKAELGAGYCQIGGLWPGTFQVQPAGVPFSFEVYLDGRGAAEIAFWQE
ncbi:MAG: hypothetical protein AAF629_16295 [Chloroflexota bacterium]